MVNEIGESFWGIYILGMEPDQKDRHFQWICNRVWVNPSVGTAQKRFTEPHLEEKAQELLGGDDALRETRTESESAGWWWGWNPCRGSGRRGCIVWAIEGGGQLWRSRGGKACGTKAASARPTQEPPLCADEEIGPFFHGTWAKNNLLSRLFFFVAIPHSTWHLSPPIRDWTQDLYGGAQSFNHWTPRDIPGSGAGRGPWTWHFTAYCHTRPCPHSKAITVSGFQSVRKVCFLVNADLKQSLQEINTT